MEGKAYATMRGRGACPYVEATADEEGDEGEDDEEEEEEEEDEGDGDSFLKGDDESDSESQSASEEGEEEEGEAKTIHEGVCHGSQQYQEPDPEIPTQGRNSIGRRRRRLSISRSSDEEELPHEESGRRMGTEGEDEEEPLAILAACKGPAGLASCPLSQPSSVGRGEGEGGLTFQRRDEKSSLRMGCPEELQPKRLHFQPCPFPPPTRRQARQATGMDRGIGSNRTGEVEKRHWKAGRHEVDEGIWDDSELYTEEDEVRRRSVPSDP